ncbi:uncharacterized protein LOC125493575 [Beta vulgaris subsp. vulgaris]|uniref:uncharacterized protein LOC125493575 n=1 Tax=Beta vulgaris subsp. vulgaris TaxID=3555 RepID=UPI0020369E89|nr:uncharacterized protein LOC125493575 [Beta vulgaris subsp. vulgaris]
MDAWNRLRDIFKDNKNSRAVTLEQEFSNTHMENFPNGSAYYQHLKTLSDQLKNVGAPVSNNRLVLKMVSGRTESYNQVATLIRQSDPLPPFYQARSMLTLQEAGLAKKASTGVALVARETDDVVPDSSQNRPPSQGGRNNSRNRGPNHGKNKIFGGNGGRHGGRSGQNSDGGGRNSDGGGRNSGGGRSPGNSTAVAGQGPALPAWPWGWGLGAWAVPPSPYPTSS